MHRLALSLLGPFQVTLDGTPVTSFGADTARALLAYLAMHSQVPHRRATLAGLLWPDQPEVEARHNLAQALYRLRAAVGDRGAPSGRGADPPFLAITRQEIGLNPDADLWLDVTAFREARAACRAHGHTQLETCDVCAERLQDAIDLYRDEFLAGFTLDSALYEEWLVVEREELHRGALEMLHALAGYHEAQGAYERAVAYGRRQIELEAWHEEAHRQVMRCLALSGDRAGALAQYEACRRALEEALGIQPEAATTALYERIRAGKELQPASALPPHNLPASLTPFVGRETDLAEIADRLADPACRLLSLVGPGGIGKTRLAVEAAWGQLDRFADGVFLVPLAAVPSPEEIVPALAQAIGFSFYGGRDLRQQLLDHLRHKRMLLVLDNIEHLLAEHLLACPEPGRGNGASLATELLSAAPGVRIVVTSRVRLNVRGEHLFSVEGMRYPETGPEALSEVEQYAAVQLFLIGAREVQPGFCPTTDDLAHVAHICRIVQGMPLAILLAAAWVRMLTPIEIAAEISENISDEIEGSLDFLAADWRDAPQRQRSMRAVFDHSYRLLSEREREVLQGLSVFRGGFTRQAAQQVTGASLRDLMALVDRSLLRREPTPLTSDEASALGTGGRYGMHELLRQYAAEKLEGNGRSRKAHDAHSIYYAQALQQWATNLKGARQEAALAEMDREIDNARAAWEWALGQGHVGRLAQGLDGLCTYYEIRGRYQEGAQACQKVSERLALSAESGEGLWLLVRARVWQSAFSRTLGDAEGAERLQEEASSLLRRSVLPEAELSSEKAFLLLEKGRLAYHRGDLAQARRCYSESQAFYRAVHDNWGVAQALSALGQVVNNSGEFGKAESILQESLALQGSLGDRRGSARTLIELSTNNIGRGRPEEAERLARQAISIRREIGDPSGVANGLFVLACTHMGRGQFAEACTLFEENIAVQRRLGNRVEQAWGFSILAWAQMNLGLYDQARASEEAALAIWRETGHRAGEAMEHLGLGGIALAQEQFEGARDWLARGLDLWREIGNRGEIASSLTFLGLAERGLGWTAQAWQHLEEALRTASEIGSRPSTLSSLSGIAVLLADEGEGERAAELYAAVTRYPQIKASQYYEDVAGRYVAAAAALPAERIEAAQARELNDVVAEALAACETRRARGPHLPCAS